LAAAVRASELLFCVALACSFTGNSAAVTCAGPTGLVASGFGHMSLMIELAAGKAVDTAADIIFPIFWPVSVPSAGGVAAFCARTRLPPMSMMEMQRKIVAVIRIDISTTSSYPVFLKTAQGCEEYSTKVGALKETFSPISFFSFHRRVFRVPTALTVQR
jgi:hypothetical protein